MSVCSHHYRYIYFVEYIFVHNHLPADYRADLLLLSTLWVEEVSWRLHQVRFGMIEEYLLDKKTWWCSYMYVLTKINKIYLCSSSHLSASKAAIHPVPAEVIAWRYLWSCTSPAANTPDTLVAVDICPFVTIYHAPSSSICPFKNLVAGSWPIA